MPPIGGRAPADRDAPSSLPQGLGRFPAYSPMPEASSTTARLRDAYSTARTCAKLSKSFTPSSLTVHPCTAMQSRQGNRWPSNPTHNRPIPSRSNQKFWALILWGLRPWSEGRFWVGGQAHAVRFPYWSLSLRRSSPTIIPAPVGLQVWEHRPQPCAVPVPCLAL